MIARNVVVQGKDAVEVATNVVEKLRADDLRIAIVFAHWTIDPGVLARELQRGFGTIPVVGCTTSGVLGDGNATALGLYGDWLRVGVGVAPDLVKAAIVGSRDAVGHAAARLGTTPGRLDPARHVAFTLVDGTTAHEEGFCIGSAASAPQIRFVGGAASSQVGPREPTAIWANGEMLADAGVVVVLEMARKFEAITSCHLVPTDVKTVVTAGVGREIHELDGVPAPRRLRELMAQLGATLDEREPSGYSFARIIDGQPYVQSITRLDGDVVFTASAVEAGHVLRVMRSGDLVDKTRKDLAAVSERIGPLSALLAFSCLGRHWEARAKQLEPDLAAVYSAYPTVGLQTFGEQTGMLFVNHTLTALAIGGPA